MPTPSGLELKQQDIKLLSQQQKIVFLCGRYEGIDDRIKKYVNWEFKLCNFIINSSELAVMTLLDAVLRFLYIKPNNLINESFYNNKNILDFPHFTRPRTSLD